jgi:hypothetical protein
VSAPAQQWPDPHDAKVSATHPEHGNSKRHEGGPPTRPSGSRNPPHGTAGPLRGDALAATSVRCAKPPSQSPEAHRLCVMPSEVPGRAVRIPAEALVIRFRPTDPDSVLGWAQKEFRHTGCYRLSLFADVQKPDETEGDLIRRLLGASEMSGIDPKSNKKYFVCTRAAELLERGFTFWKDGDDDEQDEHYSVDLGVDATRDDVVRFLGVFSPAVERPQS